MPDQACAKCGDPIGPDGSWPVTVDGKFVDGCYGCFEIEADDMWWEMVQQLPEVPHA